jgi:adenylate kinase family enzyme
MILSLFGPDGAGKSTVTKNLGHAGWHVFSGTGVASWPNQTWHNSLIAQGIDETSLEDENHFLEKIQRAHKLARDLEDKHGKVVIDSDPFHKTLMHDYRKLLPNRPKAQQKLAARLDQLSQLASDIRGGTVHIYFQVDESGNVSTQARVLHERLVSRDKLAHFDPKTIEQSQANIEACVALEELLIQSKLPVVTVTSNQPFVLNDFLGQLG